MTIVDKNAEAKGVRDVAEAYLNYLYSPVGQRLAAKHYYRPVDPGQADPVDVKRFPDVYRFSVDEVFGGWKNAQKNHFDDNGIFDSIYAQ